VEPSTGASVPGSAAMPGCLVGLPAQPNSGSDFERAHAMDVLAGEAALCGPLGAVEINAARACAFAARTWSSKRAIRVRSPGEIPVLQVNRGAYDIARDLQLCQLGVRTPAAFSGSSTRNMASTLACGGQRRHDAKPPLLVRLEQCPVRLHGHDRRMRGDFSCVFLAPTAAVRPSGPLAPAPAPPVPSPRERSERGEG
jgi:hypothetical protein